MIIRDYLILIVINFLAAKYLSIFFIETFIASKTANIFLILKETLKKR